MRICNSDIDIGIYFGKLKKTVAEFELTKGEANYDIDNIQFWVEKYEMIKGVWSAEFNFTGLMVLCGKYSTR